MNASNQRGRETLERLLAEKGLGVVCVWRTWIVGSAGQRTVERRHRRRKVVHQLEEAVANDGARLEQATDIPADLGCVIAKVRSACADER